MHTSINSIPALLSTILSLLGTTAAAQPAADTLRIMQLSDTHLCNLAGYHPAFAQARAKFGDGAESLARFLRTAPAEAGADAVVITGDLIDYYEAETARGSTLAAQIEQFAPIFFECPVPLYLILGNHDIASYWIEEPDDVESSQNNAHRARAAWIRNIPCFQHGSYYGRAFGVGGMTYRCLFLDNGYSLKGGAVLDPQQLDWLSHQLRTSGEDPVVIFMHKYLPVPDLDGDGMFFSDKNVVAIDSSRCSSGFYQLLDSHPNIKALLVGHGHKNVTETITFPAGHGIVQAETAGFGGEFPTWRMIKFSENAMVISPCRMDRKKTVIKIKE